LRIIGVTYINYMVRIVRKLLVIALVFLTCVRGEAQQKKAIRQENKAFEKALNSVESQDYLKAISLLEEIIEKSPDNTAAYLHLGICYLSANATADSAIYVFKEGLAQLSAEEQYDILGQDFFMALGKAYQVALEPDSALMVYSQMLASIPNMDKDFEAEIEHEISMCDNAKVFLANPVELTIVNLGKKVNSKYDDHSPLVSVYEDKLLFTSRREQSKLPVLNDGQYPEKVYMSHGDSASWESASALETFFRNFEHESALSLSADGNAIFIYRFDADGGKSIYMSLMENDQWSNPVKLPYPINTDAAETHASISGDRSTLFFTSDREGGYGGIDIYMCKKDAYGRWGEARNLGAAVNTKHDEETPMIHPDGATLYFASEGHNSMGRLDVFYTQMNADSTWLLPVNLGYPINTPDDDFFFLPTLDKSHAYYASAKYTDTYGGSDIYKVEFDAGFEGELAVIEGEVSDVGAARSGSVRIMVTRKTDRRLVGDYRPDKNTGKYTMFLETGHEYEVEERVEDKVIKESELSIQEDMKYIAGNNVLSFDEIRMDPPLKQIIINDQLVKEQEQFITELNDEVKTVDKPTFYTIQVLALKHKPLFASLYLKGLNVNDLKSIKCKDSYTRYIYGSYLDKKTAIEEREEIMKLGKFKDSFVRRIDEVDELKEHPVL